MTGTGDPILIERSGALATIRLNRPDRLNAVSLPLYRRLIAALEEMADDPQLRVLILTGEGRAFCAGADLKAHGSEPLSREERRTYVEAGQRAARRLQQFPRPVVAAVNGHAIGAGLELALCCDLIVVAEEAKLRFPEVSLGTFVGGGVTVALPRRVGLARARELILLCPMFSGREAEEMGLANRSVAAAEVGEVARELAEVLARMAPIPMQYARQLLDEAWISDPESAMAREAEALLACMDTRDWAEGVRAFAEKREPRFRGE